jgi:hypothetical protein
VFNRGNKQYNYFGRVFTADLGNELVLLLIMSTLPIAILRNVMFCLGNTVSSIPDKDFARIDRARRRMLSGSFTNNRTQSIQSRHLRYNWVHG